LFVHVFDPHWPYLPPTEFLESFAPRPPDISFLYDMVRDGHPPSKPLHIQQVKDLYDAEIAYADREIGRLLDGIREMGLYDRSLIIITADHGEAFWDHGTWGHTSTLYDEVIRVPLIVKWPNSIVKGRFSPQVSQTDIFPTLLNEAGIDPPESWGIDLYRQMEGSDASTARRNMVSEVSWRSPSAHL